MDDYIFIYKDSLGNYNLCTNPVFIASHKCCRAFKKSELDKDPNEIISGLNAIERASWTNKYISEFNKL